ncbi:ABC transporter permease, partial [Vibrio sp. 10N.222.55.C6]
MHDLTRSGAVAHSTNGQAATTRHRQMNPVVRLLISSAVILGLWQLVVVIFEMPSFILPTPAEVFLKLIERYDVLLK